MTVDDPCRMTAAQLAAAYRSRTLSPVEVAQAMLDRIAQLDAAIGAFCLLDPETTLVMAAASEARWRRGEPLGPGDGVPTTVKDAMLTRGWPTLKGSRTVARDQPWEADTACVARLREQGAVFLGKTSLPEFGWKAVGDSPLTGIARNPWDQSKTPGGSSGGAAAAAALGLGVWHTASDAAGSIRIPAGFCGVFGFKPTYGMVPLYPTSAFAGLGHHGPITRTVADAAAMLTVMSAADWRDATAAPDCARNFAQGWAGDIAGMRIGYARETAGVAVDDDIVSLIDAAMARLEELGAHVEAFTLDLAPARDIIEILWRVGCALTVEQVAPECRELVDPGLLAYAELGRSIAATELRGAQLEREALATRLNRLHERFDLIVTPTTPLVAFEAGCDVPPDSGYRSWLDWAPFSYPFNLTQQPAASVPCGLVPSGLPAAFQIVGPRHGDLAVLRAAHAYESTCAGGFLDSAPPIARLNAARDAS